jgi:plasmid stabilization system protein ParE
MALPIRYSPRALFEYESILDYIIQNFGWSKAMEVDSYFENIIFQIAKNPWMYPTFDIKRDIRRCVISKQTSFFYRISDKRIEIISFRGSLINPKNLNL